MKLIPMAIWGALVSAALPAFAPALAALPARLCGTETVMLLPDGRLLGHLHYYEEDPKDLVPAPQGFAQGQPCRIHRAVWADLEALLTGAKASGISGISGISCYRSIAHQSAVFCSQIGPRKASRTAAERSISVAPPAYSEHATGYAIDFAVPRVPHCRELTGCIAQTPGGQWLLAHAPSYGFELSFPDGNTQGVTYEPWHWRWVGRSAIAPGAVDARALFAQARAQFPANPWVPGEAIAAPELLPTPRLIDWTLPLLGRKR